MEYTYHSNHLKIKKKKRFKSISLLRLFSPYKQPLAKIISNNLSIEAVANTCCLTEVITHNWCLRFIPHVKSKGL